MSIFTLRWLGVAALLASLAGCLPSYQLVLRPAEGATRWQDGRQLVAAAADSLEAQMSVASAASNWVEFDVTVRNRSARPVLVAPELFYALVDFPATRNTVAGQLRVAAEDPELTLQALTQQTDFHTRKSTAVPLIEVLSSVNDLAQDLSSTKRKETTEQYNARKAAYNSEMNSYELDRTNHAVQAATLRDDVRQLEDTRLRKTTLDPGLALQGRVRFRSWNHAANHLRLVLPVAGRELSGEFVQSAYRMDGTQPPLTPAAPTVWQAAQSAQPVPAPVR